MPWTVVWEEDAEKDIQRLNKDVQERIGRAVHRLVTSNYGDVKKLVNLDADYRLRVGPWRVLFDRNTETRTLIILHVLPRGSAYD